MKFIMSIFKYFDIEKIVGCSEVYYLGSNLNHTDLKPSHVLQIPENNLRFKNIDFNSFEPKRGTRSTQKQIKRNLYSSIQNV